MNELHGVAVDNQNTGPNSSNSPPERFDEDGYSRRREVQMVEKMTGQRATSDGQSHDSLL